MPFPVSAWGTVAAFPAGHRAAGGAGGIAGAAAEASMRAGPGSGGSLRWPEAGAVAVAVGMLRAGAMKPPGWAGLVVARQSKAEEARLDE